MKNLLVLLIVCLSNIAVAQIYGEIFMDKREIVKDIDYTVNYSKQGKLVFDIKVNTDGKVTSCFINEDKSTIIAKGPMMKAKSRIMSQLLFRKGIGLPEFHSGYVQITTVQGADSEEDNKFKPPH